MKLVKELIEERKKLKLKVSLDSDMRFMQEWGKYDSVIGKCALSLVKELKD